MMRCIKTGLNLMIGNDIYRADLHLSEAGRLFATINRHPIPDETNWDLQVPTATINHDLRPNCVLPYPVKMTVRFRDRIQNINGDEVMDQMGFHDVEVL